MLDCPFHRRARACPSPCLGFNRNRPWPLGCRRFSFRSVDRGGQAPARRFARVPPFPVGRGPVPRRASVGKTALVGVRFSRRSNARGGQAPARRFARPPPFPVGRVPVPRHASIERETALVGVQFSCRSGARGGQAPALRAREGFSSLCAVRNQAIPNYGLCSPRAIAGDRPPRYGKAHSL